MVRGSILAIATKEDVKKSASSKDSKPIVRIVAPAFVVWDKAFCRFALFMDFSIGAT